MTVHKKTDSVSSLVPKPTPKITVPKPSPQPPSPKLTGLLARGQEQGKMIQGMVKPGGVMNKMVKSAVGKQLMAKATASRPPLKMEAPKAPTAKGPSANLQALLKQGQQQGKQIQGLPKK